MLLPWDPGKLSPDSPSKDLQLRRLVGPMREKYPNCAVLRVARPVNRVGATAGCRYVKHARAELTLQ
jgi:hypothetical protein